MTDYDRAGRSNRIQQAHDIPDQMKDSVLIDRLRPVALAVTAHVRGDRMEARRGECIDLVTPGVRAFWKAVAQQNKRALALLDDVQADAVSLDDPLNRFAHGPFPTKARPLTRVRAHSPRPHGETGSCRANYRVSTSARIGNVRYSRAFESTAPDRGRRESYLAGCPSRVIHVGLAVIVFFCLYLHSGRAEDTRTAP